jgi:hypothetical protein
MRKIFYSGILAIGILGFVSNANATLIFTLGGCDFSDDGGTGTCGGSGNDLNTNVMTLTFENNGVNTVRLTIATDPVSNWPAGADKIKDIWINYDPTFAFDEFSFINVTTGIIIPSSGLAPEAKKISGPGNVDGAGVFSIQFNYPTGGGNNNPDNPFNPGELSVYDISRSLGLSENDFNFPSIWKNDSSTGPFKAAFHLNITGNGESGHYGGGGNGEIPGPIPEPATMLLFGTGLIGAAGFARRKKKNQV